MTCAGRRAVKLLAEWKEIIRATDIATAGQSANPCAFKTGDGCSRSVRGQHALANATRDMRAGRDEIRFLATIGAWAATGKSGDIGGTVRFGIWRGATVVSCGAVATIRSRVRMHILRRTNHDHVFGSAR